MLGQGRNTGKKVADQGLHIDQVSANTIMAPFGKGPVASDLLFSISIVN